MAWLEKHKHTHILPFYPILFPHPAPLPTLFLLLLTIREDLLVPLFSDCICRYRSLETEEVGVEEFAGFFCANMSNHVRSNRRGDGNSSDGGSRVSGNGRREWVPRGSAVSCVSASPAMALDNDLASNNTSGQSKGDPSRKPYGNNGVSGYVLGHGGHGFKGHQSRTVNHRRDKETARGDNSQGKVLKDPNLPQLVQEIQEKLLKGTVECMICCDMVRRSAPIWSCSSCYSIFHLNCIRKWARAPTSIDLSADKNRGDNWRCPGCQHVQLTTPKDIQYLCFCGKRSDPPSDLYLTPHSCGEPCGKPLERDSPHADEGNEDFCPHVCVLPCHPGPCPPCKAFAPPRDCPCGKKTITARCSDRRSFRTCGQLCDKLLECGRHRCERICHVGACDSCTAAFSAPCFCRKKVENVLCGEIAVKGIFDVDRGVFTCGSTCGKLLDCGNHFCSNDCHPDSCEECEFLPSKFSTCYCGKMSVHEQRRSCLDPIPTCSQVCGKLLPCGSHICEETCHAGGCPPCLVSVTQHCRCGFSSRSVECFRTKEEVFTCDKQCGRKKNCGRHRCSERCCPFSNTNVVTPGEWDPHLCSMSCGKKLRCGQHSCESFCHSGHCPPCLETIFTDLTCACGRTSIPPPVPCGTPPPSCQLPCSVPQPCGHQSSHSCHFGECPPCSVPVAKECVGGHVVLRNIPCGSKDIRCNKICGKTRQCGLHACGRSCHAPPCDSDMASGLDCRVSCGQTCGAPRRDCRHTCKAPCHPSTPCPDVRCDVPVTISCSCGRIQANVPCDAGGTSGSSITDTLVGAALIQRLPVPLQPVDTDGGPTPLGQRKLACDDECARIERKKVLADAFDIAPPNLEALHFGENTSVSESIADIFRRDPKWVLSIEERCKFLVLGKSRGSAVSMKVHVFCPMAKEKRDAVRLIAERWKLTVTAAGWEPKRFVAIHATPKSKVPPRVIGVKGSITSSGPHPPPFDPLLDMDPRLVVSFFDLPKEADISALVLRFGGECELVWLNDKNALAVFHDPARAATALRRLDHGSVYYGAVVVVQNGGAASAVTGGNPWGGSGPVKDDAALKSNPWKRAVVQEPSWKGDSWGGVEFWPADAQSTISKAKEAPTSASGNRWSILDSENTMASGKSSTSARNKDIGSDAGIVTAHVSTSGTERERPDLVLVKNESSEVVEDWEDACE
ncbi:hypothetical protein MLD38_038269 [Melastoma candidum]|uniref:Uncharacterized protein n=1 Tax=Melastoma candidum TaxID=119954 RepID=A0ACB9KZ05_9MYRT|nr:hypothetical protein MLD38_038269 [Melastoma candidum]